MEVRRRRFAEREVTTKEFLENFDAFPKLPRECKQMTVVGGVATILTVLILIFLMASEVYAFWHSKFMYTYEVDDDISSRIQINVDITVATRCEYTSLDVLDITGVDQPTEGVINYERTHYRLYKEELNNFNKKQLIGSVLRDHPLVLHEMLWSRTHFEYLHKQGYFKTSSSSAQQHQQAVTVGDPPDPLPYDACRMHGSIYVKKVIGNMHIIPGKPMGGIGNLHIHLTLLREADAVLNFSHRINHLSFGSRIGDTLEPLEGVEMISHTDQDTFQYIITIVPTRIVGFFYHSDTYQYAATVKSQTVDHSKEVHGHPGIMFLYDTFPLRVKITEHRELLGTFLARMAAVVGGLFAFVDLFRQASCGIPELVWHSRAARSVRRRWLTSSNGGAGAVPCPLDPD